MAPAPPQRLNRVRALLFDLGGVLIDIDFRRVTARWAAHAGVDEEALPADLRDRLIDDPIYAAYECGRLGTQAFFRHLRKLLELPLDDAQLLDGWNAVLVAERSGIRPLLLNAARHRPLYLFSNTNAAHHAVWANDYAAMLAPFTRQFVSHVLGLRKPDTPAFHAVAETLGLAPEEILFFDDTPDNVRGAIEAGMPARLVHGNQDIADALAELTG